MILSVAQLRFFALEPKTTFLFPQFKKTGVWMQLTL